MGTETEDPVTLYDMLGLSENATLGEIEAAYSRMADECEQDALALYSVIGDDELTSRRTHVEFAYEVLSDLGRRAQYDQSRRFGYPSLVFPRNSLGEVNTTAGSIGSVGNAAQQVSFKVDRRESAQPSVSGRASGTNYDVRVSGVASTMELEVMVPRESGEVGGPGGMAPSSPEVPTECLPDSAGEPTRSETKTRPKRFCPSGDALGQLGSDPEYTGSLLRSLRESSGASLEDLESITKISRRHLRAIEHNDFEALPAKVYVRGFVDQYARALGLDAPRVTATYVALYDRTRRES